MDFEMILFFAFAEIMMDEESSDTLKELRLEALKKLHRNLSHYHGSKFVEDPTIVPEEELICWSHTSLRAPLNSIGSARFKEVFQRVFPNGVNAELKEDADE